MFLQLTNHFILNDNRFITFDDLVGFCLSQQPSWSNWKKRDIEYWIANGLKNNLVYWVSTGYIIETLVVGRKTEDEKEVEVLQFCGNFRRHAKAFVHLCGIAHPQVNRISYLRNTRKNSLDLSKLTKHI